MGCLAYPLTAAGILAVLSADSIVMKVAAWLVWNLAVLSLLLAASAAASAFREG